MGELKMNTGRSCSFWDLYNNPSTKGIKIPQIQRDYAQGRKSERIRENRGRLVEDLAASLIDEKELNLNFVYGYYEDNCFVPIDGQQRLTTLFLFHLFVFAKAGDEAIKNGKLKFFYETRFDNLRFFEKLKKFDFNATENTNPLSKIITNSFWFAGSWCDNPTIMSCLVMIDEIQKVFAKKPDVDWKEMCKRLTSKGCPIRFMLLEIDKGKLGRPNELYIKMNSRGKQLTDFENFKSSLFGWMKDNGKNNEMFSKIRKSVDNEWLEMIWNIQEEKSNAEKYADIFYRDIFHWIFMTRIAVESCKLTKQENLFEQLKPKSENIKEVYLGNYLDWCKEFGGNKFEICLEDVYCTMNVLCQIQKNEDCWKKIKELLLNYVVDNKYSNILSSYKERVMLFAITKFGKAIEKIKGNDEKIKKFQEWFRIIKNLTTNSQIDSPKSFDEVCVEIDNFQYADNITENIEKINFEKFRKEIVEEEKFKQKLINSDSNWEKEILKAEDSEYFNGEIRFIFRLLNIDEKIGYDEDTKTKFDEILKKVINIFEFAKKDEEQEHLFHRLLLTYGDYSYENENGVRCFYRFSEAHHNNDWRGMLRSIDKENNGFNCFNSLITDIKVGTDLKQFAEKRIKNNKNWSQLTKNDIDEGLRTNLINMGELFDYCKNYYYIWHDYKLDCERWLLMKNSVLNCYVEANVYALFSKLKGSRFVEGATRYDEERRSSYLEYKGYKVEFKKKPNESSGNFAISKANNIIENIENLDDVVKFFKKNS